MGSIPAERTNIKKSAVPTDGAAFDFVSKFKRRDDYGSRSVAVNTNKKKSAVPTDGAAFDFVSKFKRRDDYGSRSVAVNLNCSVAFKATVESYQ